MIQIFGYELCLSMLIFSCHLAAFGQSSSSPFGSQPVFGQTNNVSNNPFAPKPFGSTSPFGTQTGGSIFGGMSTGVFGAQSSSPLGSTSVFGASSSPAFGSSTPTFGASTGSAFGNSSSAFGGMYNHQGALYFILFIHFACSVLMPSDIKFYKFQTDNIECLTMEEVFEKLGLCLVLFFKLWY